jgi:hypothetical protein
MPSTGLACKMNLQQETGFQYFLIPLLLGIVVAMPLAFQPSHIFDEWWRWMGCFRRNCAVC